ncbi:homoserine dehydrogenase, partial [Enterococcus faecalis]
DIGVFRGLSFDDVQMAIQHRFKFKLIGTAEQNEKRISVEEAPMLVIDKLTIASVVIEYNAVFI